MWRCVGNGVPKLLLRSTSDEHSESIFQQLSPARLINVVTDTRLIVSELELFKTEIQLSSPTRKSARKKRTKEIPSETESKEPKKPTTKRTNKKLDVKARKSETQRARRKVSKENKNNTRTKKPRRKEESDDTDSIRSKSTSLAKGKNKSKASALSLENFDDDNNDNNGCNSDTPPPLIPPANKKVPQAFRPEENPTLQKLVEDMAVIRELITSKKEEETKLLRAKEK